MEKVDEIILNILSYSDVIITEKINFCKIGIKHNFFLKLTYLFATFFKIVFFLK